MGDAVRPILRQISSNTATVNGAPVYIGGNEFNVQAIGPGTPTVTGTCQVSDDKYNWVSARDINNATVTLGNSGLSYIATRPVYARIQLAADTAASRVWNYLFGVRKEE